MAGAYLHIAEHQRGINPRLFYRCVHMRRQIRDRGCTPWQAIQGFGEILGNPPWIQTKVLDEPMEIRILQLQNLMQPMHQFHIRITPQFAKYGGTLNGFIA